MQPGQDFGGIRIRAIQICVGGVIIVIQGTQRHHTLNTRKFIPNKTNKKELNYTSQKHCTNE